MFEIQIPKDIRTYDAKLIGPFTTRQTICVGIGSLLAIIAYNTIGQFVSQDLRIFICLVVVLPALLAGWVKPYGMPFEKYALVILTTHILAPKYRKYKTINAFEMKTPEEKEAELERRKEIIKANEKYRRSKKKDPEFVDYE